MSITEVLGIIAAGIAIAVPLGKWLVVTPLKNFIREQTYPIQPNSNGGRSLPDIAHAVNRIEKRLDEHINLHIKGDA
jgi:hypothetical protein